MSPETVKRVTEIQPKGSFTLGLHSRFVWFICGWLWGYRYFEYELRDMHGQLERLVYGYVNEDNDDVVIVRTWRQA